MISLFELGPVRKEVFILSQKNLFLLLVLIFLSSCGTLKKRDNIVFADSFPRGLKVKNEKGSIIGVTPFFLEVDTFKSRVYSFYSDEKVKLDVRYGCPFDWGGSIVPNMIFVFQPVISLSFMLTDLLTGGPMFVVSQFLESFLISILGRSSEKNGSLSSPLRLEIRSYLIKLSSFGKRKFSISTNEMN